MTRHVRLSVWLFVALLWCGTSHAAPPKQINVTPAAPANQSQTWLGSGAVTFTQLFCVTSQNLKNGMPVAYNLTATSSGSATQFYLTGASSNIPFTATWNASALTAGVPLTGIPGSNLACPGTNNGTLNIQITPASLTAAAAGTYTTTLTLVFYNSANGNSGSQTVTLTISLTVPNLIQISQLTNLNLGTFNGASGLAGSETLCIYRNSPGNYGVTVTGQGSGGAFVAISGANQVPLALTWNDGTGAVALSAGTLLSGRTNANLTSPSCSSGASNNATLGASATAASLSAASAGSYLGTLTLTVQPQ